MIATTAEYSQTLTITNATIKGSIPKPGPLPPIDKILSSQMDVSVDMAHRLESLAGHYDQMAAALKDSEAGESFSEEDLQGKYGGRTFMALPALTALVSPSYE